MTSPPRHLRRIATTIALSGIAAGAAAQSSPDARLSEINVFATSLVLGASDMILPYSVLADEELVRKRETTLGDTLVGEPGIRASNFGPGASRPIIRGLDGPRVRILGDGAEVMDASSMSPDHAVALEPLLARQIEILRGPAALAYGGGAVGGVVNVLDDRIPTEVPANGITGNVEVRGGTAAKEAAGAFGLTAGAGNFAVHAEGLKRDARDLRVGRGWDQGRYIEGSQSQSDTGSLGVSWIGERGYIGLAYTNQRSDYGLPGHAHEMEECHAHGDHLHCDDHDDHGDRDDHGDVPVVDLKSQRWDLRSDLHTPFSGIARLGLRAAHTDYRHDEIEDDEVATRFRSKAHDARVELEHEPLAGWRGVVGMQTTRRDFSAIGEEAYVQPTLTRRNSVFVIEEYRSGDWRFEAGLRQEWQNIDVESNQRDRSHRGTSVSLGANWRFVPGYSLAASLSRTQRLPTAEELYADGPHLATRTIEIGKPDLDAETARNVDLTLRKLSGDTTFSVSVFHNRIADYIHAATLDAHEGLRLIEYAQRDATFTGIEGEIRQRIDDTFAVTAFGDHVRGKFSRSEDGRNLPRIPAWRAGLRLDARHGAWGGEIEWVHVGAQDRIARFESKSESYDQINLAMSYNGRYGATPFQLYVRLNNLTDELAFNHASFVKEDAPLAGRNLVAGLRVSF